MSTEEKLVDESIFSNSQINGKVLKIAKCILNNDWTNI
jgi:hypothetical protein